MTAAKIDLIGLTLAFRRVQHARQTKFWVYDPDGTRWEVYTLDEDIEHRGAGQVPSEVMPRPEPQPVANGSEWEHRMNEPVPERVLLADAACTEVRLRGTLNLDLGDAERERTLAEAWRLLRPGGRLFVHVLTTDRPYAGSPNLPGPAAAVRHVPVEAEVVGQLERAGFRGVRMLKFDAKPCFVRDGVPMRETQIEAWKPAEDEQASVSVLYKGPFRQVADDAGNVYPRGRWTKTDAATAERLRAPEWSSQFLIVNEA